MLAFHNDPARKQAVLERIREHLDAGDVVPLPAYWDKGKGGPAACAVHDADPAAFEQALDISRAILPIVEAIYRKTYNTAPPHVEVSLDVDELALARAFPFDWLDVLPLGADVRDVPARMILWMLGDPLEGTITAVSDEEVLELLAQVLAAHRSVLAGGSPAAAEWSSLRRRAMKLADSLPPGSLNALAAVTIESAAWPTTASGNIALDVFDSYVNGFEALAAAQTGWSAEDREMAERFRVEQNQEMAEALKGLEGEAWQNAAQRIVRAQREVIDRDHPDFQTKQLAFRRAYDGLRWGRVLSAQRALLDLLQRAPVPATL